MGIKLFLHKFRRLSLIVILMLTSNGFVFAEEHPESNTEVNIISSPLSLEEAIGYASNHPRTRLSFQELQLYPSKQSLFLNCHNLTFNNTSSIDNRRNSIEPNLVAPLERQKLQILQYFLDVLLADLNLIVINENMAGTYIDYDRAKTRFELKQVSEVIVAGLNAEYQEVRQQFHASEATQRLTRSVLAQAINHPKQLPSELISPKLFKFPDELPELDDLVQQALDNNSWIRELKKNTSKDQFSLLKMELRQEILELILRLKVLKTAKQRADIDSYRRELNLDLSRTLYEMEVKASLGNSMSLQSKARMDDERFAYCQLLAWAQLNALQGRPLLTPPREQKKPE